MGGHVHAELGRQLVEKALVTLGKEELQRYFELFLDRLVAGMTAAERTALAAEVVETSLSTLLAGLSLEERSRLLDSVVGVAFGQLVGGGTGEEASEAASDYEGA